jgi:allantoin racemase
MRILVINPNSSAEMTKAIQKLASSFFQDETEVVTLPTPGAPVFIETYEDEVRAAPGMISLIRENEDDFDGFVIACHCDPNLDVLKEITPKPVVGIGEASMKIASMLGHRFSVVSTHPHSIPNKEVLIRKYYLDEALASVRAPEGGMEDYADEERLFLTAKSAIEEDGAEIIVLGCAGMAGVDSKLQERLGVPVLDGVICGLIIVSGLVRYGVSTSKKRRYNPDYGA